jgi:Ser/Thr protein kinase RdoA (MazF antagonist)
VAEAIFFRRHAHPAGVDARNRQRENSTIITTIQCRRHPYTSRKETVSFMSFEHLTPDTILTCVERTAGIQLTGLTAPLPSYINRVYELCTHQRERLIVKFYRPGRWSREAILDEHRFIRDCAHAEVPVVEPLPLATGHTLDEQEGFFLALYPKRAGRQLEITDESDWTRLGALVARIHNAGTIRRADNRVTIDPRRSARDDIEYLCTNVIPHRFNDTYRSIASQLVAMSTPLFEGLEYIRLHGDCHRGNILDRLDEGLMVIDFDDMAMGPPVQDLWLLLPERPDKARREIELFLRGYERFRAFDRRSLRCIEPLRAMRMIYFLAWCSRQRDDHQFKKTFPDWGSDGFWQREISDLREQAGFVFDSGQ